jgi:hypothetical protein
LAPGESTPWHRDPYHVFFSGAVTLFYTQYLVEPQTLPSGDGDRAAR